MLGRLLCLPGDRDSRLTSGRARGRGVGSEPRAQPGPPTLVLGTAGRSTPGLPLEARRRIWELPERPEIQSGRFQGPTIGGAPQRPVPAQRARAGAAAAQLGRILR